MAKITKTALGHRAKALGEGSLSFTATDARTPPRTYCPSIGFYDERGRYTVLRLDLDGNEARELHRWLGLALAGGGTENFEPTT